MLMWLFRQHRTIYLIFVFLISMTASASEHITHNSKSAAQNKKLQQFAWKEFQARSNAKKSFSDDSFELNDKKITFSLNTNLSETYCLTVSENTITALAKTLDDGKWLVYQILELLSQTNTEIKTDDLPPASIKLSTHCKTFDFEYREPFFPTNLEKGNTIVFGTHSVDLHWGLWGHNISKITTPADEIFATTKDGITENQFCFSSELLFKQFSDYVLNNFGENTEESVRFMVMPEDNNIACLCENCKKIGNTEGNASPATAQMLKKLAEKFPMHLFFTSSYHTTSQPPNIKLPPNTGVFISTIELPQIYELNKENTGVNEFANTIQLWKKSVSHVYVWDYASNFDDYLTPIPILYSLQKRLAFFKNEGVNGVFFNASGYDYSSFEDLKTYIISNLLQQTDIDIPKHIRMFFRKFYPENHQLLSDYYINLEENFSRKNRPINIYGSLREILATYLNEFAFMDFYEELNSIQHIPDNLKKLSLALHFTRLQIALHKGVKRNGFAVKKEQILEVRPEIKGIVAHLKNYQKTDNLHHYREETGALDNYIKNWEELIFNSTLENKILELPIQSNLDYSEVPVEILTDGIPGFSPDYHLGWYISTEILELSFQSPITERVKIQMRFLENEKHRFAIPEKIEIYINGRKLNNTIYQTNTYSDAHVMESEISLNKGDEITIRLVIAENTKNKIALDEIRIL